MTRALLIPVALFALWLAGGRVPYDWAHTLGEDCSWRPRGALAVLGRAGRLTEQAERACKGMASPLPEVKVFLAKFPTPAERAAWRE